MTYKDKTLCKIRTITTFISLDKNKATWKDEIKQAAQFCLNLTSKLQRQRLYRSVYKNRH